VRGGSEQSSGETPKPGGSSAAAADRATTTRDAVREDVRVALAEGGFEAPRTADAPTHGTGCELYAVVRTGDRPDRDAVADVAAGLRGRGWREERHTALTDADGRALEKGGWMLMMVAGSLSESALPGDLATAGHDTAAMFTGLSFRGPPRPAVPARSRRPSDGAAGRAASRWK
jgi:hypothetical protein